MSWVSSSPSNTSASRRIDCDIEVAPAFTFGNVGPVLSDVRNDWIRNVDSVLVKNFGFNVTDHRVTAQFRFEVYNLTNTVQFAAPGSTVGSQTFRQISAQANSPRDLQFGLKFAF